jgi:hypothetical protein
MADTKISALTAASTPLAGTEVLPIVQSGTTKKVSVADLTAGRAITALTYGGFTIASQYMGYAGESGLAFFTPNVLPTNGTALNDTGINLGSAFWRWNTVYAATALINTSDANLKQDVELLSDKEQRVAVAIKGLIRTYRLKDAVAVKGDAARIHVGVMAQDVKAAFEAEGLDATRYALFCSDTVIDEETNESKTRLGIRYEELLAFVIAAL